MDPERMRAWVNLAQAGRVIEDVLEDRLGTTTGLTVAQYEVLRRLSDAPEGAMRMLDVATLLLFSKSGMTRLVDRLAETGFVERKPCDYDRRVVYAKITKAGRDALEKATKVFEEGIEEAFGRHLTDADVRSMRRALNKVIEANGRGELDCSSGQA